MNRKQYEEKRNSLMNEARLLKEETSEAVPTDLLKAEWDFLMLKRR